MLILSIDVGIRNFGTSVYDTEKEEFVLFNVQDLKKIKDTVALMREMTSKEPFTSVDVILVERQMRAIMKTMATSIRAFHFEKTVMITPQSVKRFFKSSGGCHSKNKKAAVELARTFLNEKNLALFETLKKKDDIADCIIQTMYYLKRLKPTLCKEPIRVV